MVYEDFDSLTFSDEAGDFRREAHEFARDHLRPAGRTIDRMDPSDYASLGESGSIYWEVLEEFRRRDFHRRILPEEFGGGGLSGEHFYALLEELGWGSAGLAMALSVDMLPALLAFMSFDETLFESYAYPFLNGEIERHQGCWGVTEPAHGSEHVMSETLLRRGPQEDHLDFEDPEVTAVADGDGYVLSGEKSSWISAAPMASHMALHVNMEPSEGDPGGLCLVELDRDGVEQGDPIDKLGQRDCPQGSVRFDDVRIPERNMILEAGELHPDTGFIPLSQILCLTSAGMSAVSTGLARAAFEEAVEYTHGRKQGGKRVQEHQSVRRMLYDMYETVETCRSYSREVTANVWERNVREFEFDASVHHALSAQVYCKRKAFDVANQALQLHGARGILKETPVEKMFRDARVKMIEDGTTEVLGLESIDKALREL